MSYERVYRVTEDVSSELKKYASRSSDGECEKYKMNLLLYCMLDHSGEDTKKVIDTIDRHMFAIDLLVSGDAHKYVVDECERDGCVSFCGYCYDGSKSTEDYSDFRLYVLRELSILAIAVKTPDYFEESEKFSDKQSDIASLIDDYCSECIEKSNIEIIGKLEKFGLKPLDDDDEYDEPAENTEFPDGGLETNVSHPVDCEYEESVSCPNVEFDKNE